ncbi:MAG: VWA domain-containing protein [Chloroflexota bacterium]|nr:VWA domain-containing protein [Chloroflexota bacterium]
MQQSGFPPGGFAPGSSTQSYQRRWAADMPGCLILLLDQSKSMDEQMGAGVIGAGQRKADAASMVVNNVLKEVVKRCTQGSAVRPRVDLALVGYGPGQTVHNALGGMLGNQDMVSVADLAMNPLRINHTVIKEFDPETGSMIQVPMDVPIWVEPVADNGTPMCAAMDAGYYLAYNWVMNHPDNFPPIIVNITDGASTDGDPRPNAARFGQLATNDGATLLFNCHLSSTGGYQVRYPADPSQVPHDPDGLAAMLFEISSPLPEQLRAFGNSTYGMSLLPGARGFVFGGDIMDLTQFITIASLPKTDR